MINEKYSELLQAIAKILTEKNAKIDGLKAEIKALKNKIADIEKKAK